MSKCIVLYSATHFLCFFSLSGSACGLNMRQKGQSNSNHHTAIYFFFRKEKNKLGSTRCVSNWTKNKKKKLENYENNLNWMNNIYRKLYICLFSSFLITKWLELHFSSIHAQFANSSFHLPLSLSLSLERVCIPVCNYSSVHIRERAQVPTNQANGSNCGDIFY